MGDPELVKCYFESPISKFIKKTKTCIHKCQKCRNFKYEICYIKKITRLITDRLMHIRCYFDNF